MTRINSTPSPVAARPPEAAKPAAAAAAPETAAPAAAKGWQAGAPKRIEAPPSSSSGPMHVDSSNPPMPASSSTQAANVALQFYDAFVHQNSAGMEKAYAPDVKFKDTLFEFGDRAGTMKMWKSILSKAGDKPHFQYTVDSKWARQALPLGPLVDFPGARTLLTALIRATV
jgi:hypothetical protein